MLLDAVGLSQSGRPELVQGEVERLIIDKVDLSFEGRGGVVGSTSDKYTGGYAVLTSHRVLWIDAAASPSAGLSCFVPLSAIHSTEVSKYSWAKKAPKLKLSTYESEDGRPAAGGMGAVRVGKVSLVCHGGITEKIREQLDLALQQKAWRQSEASVSGQTHDRVDGSRAASASAAGPRSHPGVNVEFLEQLVSMGFSRNRAIRAILATHNTSVAAALDHIFAFYHDPTLDYELDGDSAGWVLVNSSNADDSLQTVRPPVGSAGVMGIMRKQEEQAKEATKSLQTAFQDLEALMGMAHTMVGLAEKFHSKLRGAGTTSDDELMDEETMSELIRMGIASPVTKESAGARYHQELARQLSDFLLAPLERAGGMMTLTDVYSLFNRARGTALISPDDLLQASGLFPSLGLPLRLHTFASGVIVIQSLSHSDSKVAETIGGLVADDAKCQAPISASDVAKAMKVPVTIAQEHLLTAEQHRVLCRDDGPEGLRFFRNFFWDAAG